MSYDIITRLINENNYDKAIEQVELLLKENYNDDELFYLKGKIYQRLMQWNNAVNAYKKAIELNSNSKAVVALELLYNILGSINNEIVSP